MEPNCLQPWTNCRIFFVNLNLDSGNTYILVTSMVSFWVFSLSVMPRPYYKQKLWVWKKKFPLTGFGQRPCPYIQLGLWQFHHWVIIDLIIFLMTNIIKSFIDKTTALCLTIMKVEEKNWFCCWRLISVLKLWSLLGRGRCRDSSCSWASVIWTVLALSLEL